MRRLCGAQTIALRVPGVRTPLLCRTFGADRWVLREVFGRQHYEFTLQDSPQLIVDGGANVGYASIYFANKYPNAQIIAVEPDPENCALFRKNCAAYPNIELIQGALWTSSTDLVIENPTTESWAFRVVEVPSPTNRSFKGVTVADILARSGKQHVDLLKLDIEGSEEQLFSSNYADWIGRVKNLMVEVHGGQRCRNVVLGATKDRGFAVFQSGHYVILEKEASQDQPEREETVR
jgi:FkbM family methyltransferase